MLDNVTTRFLTYREAYKVLTRKRAEVDAGTYDARDYQIKAKPLAFDGLAREWLAIKAKRIKPESLKPLRLGMERAIKAWGGVNIKTIQYAHVEDFINGLDKFSAKSRKHTLDALKQFWQWVVDRLDVPPMTKWPRLGYVEMAFRLTVDIPTQEAILDDIRAHEPFRVWLCIKWLATYIAIRPGEMCNLTEGLVDRGRGVLIIPHPKEKRAKIVPLIQEDIDLIQTLPLAFDSAMPFFRHECVGERGGKGFGHDLLYRAWKRACARLNIQGVSLYPGTRHSTAMGLRGIATPEEIKSMTLHSTSVAFHRYFQTGGEALRELQSRRRLIVADNGLTMKKAVPATSQIIEFTRK
jgi:integrase